MRRVDLCENHGDRLCFKDEEEEEGEGEGEGEEEEEEEGERQIVSLGDSRIKRVLDRLATLSIPTVRVEALEYS